MWRKTTLTLNQQKDRYVYDQRRVHSSRTGFKENPNVERRRRISGEWNREVVTLFMDNFPEEMCWEWLLQIFRIEGRIVDVYVSHKKRKKDKSAFGFVRFRVKKEALRAMKKLDGLVIREHKDKGVCRQV